MAKQKWTSQQIIEQARECGRQEAKKPPTSSRLETLAATIAATRVNSHPFELVQRAWLLYPDLSITIPVKERSLISVSYREIDELSTERLYYCLGFLMGITFQPFMDECTTGEPEDAATIIARMKARKPAAEAA